MAAILLRRLRWLPIVLLGVSIITFSFTYLTPGDPVMNIFWARYGEDFTPSDELLDQIRVEAGLDKPLPLQYLSWLNRLVRGDLGDSFVDKKPIVETLARRFPITLQVGAVSLILALLVAVPLGTWAATHPYSWIDTLSTILSNTGVAVPQYWIGPVLILVLSVKLRLLPTAGWGTPKHLALPVLTLFLMPLAFFTRMVRAGLLEVLQQDYIRTARAKGLPPWTVLWRHAFKNAFIPLVSVFGLRITGALAGSVIVETIFAVPGIGSAMYQAVRYRDLPMIQACTLIFVGTAVIANALADVTYVLLNPAIHYDRGST
jgi:peptide/nickel transport system permease protein